jgi:hypothetical protein
VASTRGSTLAEAKPSARRTREMAMDERIRGKKALRLLGRFEALIAN